MTITWNEHSRYRHFLVAMKLRLRAKSRTYFAQVSLKAVYYSANSVFIAMKQYCVIKCVATHAHTHSRDTIYREAIINCSPAADLCVSASMTSIQVGRVREIATSLVSCRVVCRYCATCVVDARASVVDNQQRVKCHPTCVAPPRKGFNVSCKLNCCIFC